MHRRYDHIDWRVRNLAEARPFYETLLPALGFTLDARIEGWLQFEAAGADSATEFFGVTESSRHVANECRIAFWADSPSEVNGVCAEQKRGQQSLRSSNISALIHRLDQSMPSRVGW
jgi:catechol 2,3-dioxygenase-like lactoylglutathione lyase family enzyme